MIYDTPLRKRHEAWASQETQRIAQHVADATRPGAAEGQRVGAFEVTRFPYGPGDEQHQPMCELVESFGPVEPEYAAIRRDAGLFDACHRAVIEIRGDDRLDFLDRLVTNQVGELRPGDVRRAFWIKRTGRIISDLLIAHFEDRTLLICCVHVAQNTLDTLDAFLFTEDVQLNYAPGKFAVLRLDGPASYAALGGAVIEQNTAREDTIGGASVAMINDTQTGEPGVLLVMSASDAEQVWDALLAWRGEGDRRIRPVGFSAFNTARIEAGTPLFNIDFGTDALPHETGVLDDRVHFSKGCYPGQEIVARIQSLGSPKQRLCALDLEGEGLPVAGSQVFVALDAADGTKQMGPQIGLVTSSTLSPMLGGAAIALAMVRSEYAEPGQSLLVSADGNSIAATPRASLRFLRETAQ